MTQLFKRTPDPQEGGPVTPPFAPPGSVDDVERRADDISRSRSGPRGTDLDDWPQAERELRGASRERASSLNARLSNEKLKAPPSGANRRS